MINNIMLLFGCVADTYLMYLFFSHYFEECRLLRKSKVRSIFYVIFAGIWFISNLFGNGDCNLIISAILIFLYAVMILQGKWGYKLLCYAVLFGIQFGCEFLFMLIFHPDEEAYKNSFNTEFQMLVIKFLTYLMIIFVTQFVGKAKTMMSRKTLLMYLCLPTAGITVMITNFYAGTYDLLTKRMRAAVLLAYAFLFLGNIVIFYAFQLYSQKAEETLNQRLLIIKQEADLMLYNKVEQMNEG